MAWYAELKRLNWYCVKGMAMDFAYQRAWYGSLSDDEKKDTIGYKISEEDGRNARTALAQLIVSSCAICSL